MLTALAGADPPGDAGLSGIGSQWRKTLAALMEQGWVRSGPMPPACPKISPGPNLIPDQRKAVDAVAAASFGEAADVYEKLAKKYPDNKAYAAAAAITRAKAERQTPE